MIIYRDKDGSLINIGKWEDMDGTNPLPDGAYSEEAEVVTGYDGGLYLADDPRANN
jgi:hypothetical protein